MHIMTFLSKYIICSTVVSQEKCNNIYFKEIISIIMISDVHNSIHPESDNKHSNQMHSLAWSTTYLSSVMRRFIKML